MNIRKLKNDERDFLGEMLYEAIFIPEGHKGFSKDIIKEYPLSKYIDNWGKDEYDIAFVIEIDNQLVGAIWGRLFTQENKGFGFVDNNTPELSMAVKPEFRNKGIGTDMMKVIVSYYKNLGIKYLSLSVDKANKALRLYQRLGYEIIDETETSYTMRKKIK